MVDQARADAATPADWVDAAAIRAADDPALVLDDGIVTYGQLRDLVHARMTSVPAPTTPGELLPTPVRLDLPSIVELLALPAAGMVPVPYALEPPGVPVPAAPDAVVCVATSGSSGLRRLVPLTMANVTASVAASQRRLGTGVGDRWLLTLPLEHVAGLSVLYRSFAAGGTVVVADFERRARLLDATTPTVASLVPTMVHRMLDEDPDRLAAIDLVLVGGGPLRSGVIDRAASAGVTLVPSYGSTETASQVATVVPGTRVAHPGYVGPPLDGFDVALDDAGVITVDGPAVFGGYLGGPSRRSAHRTGDLGRFEADGGLTVVGRADDVVVSGGENVSLGAIADRIDRIDGVDDVAVVAIGSDEWGSEVCALVATELPDAEILDRIAATLAGPEKPRRIRTTGAIPLLANGKHDRVAVERVFVES